MPFAYAPRSTDPSAPIKDLHVEPGAVRLVYPTATPIDAVGFAGMSLELIRVPVDDFKQWVSQQAEARELED